jgi:hypothetical protein
LNPDSQDNVTGVTGQNENNEELEQPMNSLNLTNFAIELDRRGISDRDGAALASAVLQDVGSITNKKKDLIVDRSKIRRTRARVRNDLKKNRKRPTQNFGLFFDGKKDKKKTIVKNNGKAYIKKIVEDHYVLVEEPNSEYFGHITVSNGKAATIATEILSKLEKENIDKTLIDAIGCDGTNVNTGRNNGVVRRLETGLDRPVQWLVCLLHMNELPLRHLLEHLDGVTTGPNSFTGPIGQKLSVAEQFKVCKFSRVESNIPSNLRDLELSKDQQYLFLMCHAVESGKVSRNLANLTPGPVVHSRWLTTACRILRFYGSCTKPTAKLKLLVCFIQKVYAPAWFIIKNDPVCTSGAKHLWLLIQLSRYLRKKEREVVDRVIQQNAYFGHPENILIAMLVDEEKRIRQLAFSRIMAARSNINDESVRKFVVPVINFQARTYVELVDWDEPISEPPMTRHIPADTFKKHVEDNTMKLVLSRQVINLFSILVRFLNFFFSRTGIHVTPKEPNDV